MKGAFITFEGGEASGKSTQVPLLAKALQDKGYDVLVTREPGGDEGGERIRSLLLEKTWHPLTELLLFSASRYEHSLNLIQPAVARGAVVLCDRFFDSSVAYQGYGLGVPLEFIDVLKTYVVPRQPDLTFIMDVDPNVAEERLQKRGGANYMDTRPLSFHEKVRQGYQKILRDNPQRCVWIDGEGEKDVIHHNILNQALVFLEKVGVSPNAHLKS